jgi:poly-gamma-glutamate synthase PgsB/CapB
MLPKPHVLPVLATGLNPFRMRLDRMRLEGLAGARASWLRTYTGPIEDEAHGAALFLLEWLEEECSSLARLIERRDGFERLSARTVSGDERRQLILETARQLGSSGASLWADSRALGRWFDEVAVGERFERAIGECRQRICFGCERLGAVVAERLHGMDEQEQLSAWAELSLEAALWDLSDRDRHPLIICAALDCWSAVAGALRPSLRASCFSSRLRQRVTRLAQDRREPVSKQIAALDLLALVERKPLRIVIQQRLASPLEGDDFFVRAHVVKLIGRLLDDLEELVPLLALATEDPSPLVRQEVGRQLDRTSIDVCTEHWLELVTDPVAEVRGVAYDVVPKLLDNGDLVAWLGATLRKVLVEESDATIARIGLEALVRGYTVLSADSELASEWWHDSIETLAEVRSNSPSIPLRRTASEFREVLWVLHDPEARELLESLRDANLLPRAGESRQLPRALVGDRDPWVVGRVLSVLAQEDFPLDLEKGRRGRRLTRGFRFRFRLWRFLHELRHPQPDKRQAFRHTIGRVHYGEIRAPSARLAELAETKVPGEPLHIAEEGGWRPYLPLVDDCLSLLNQSLPGRPTLFFTSEGVSEVRPPAGIRGRLRAYLQLNWNYPHYARLRNWRASSQASPSAYVDALTELGFTLSFQPHAERPTVESLRGPGLAREWAGDPSVTRHFPMAVLPLGLDLWDRFLDYALSIYENSLFDLALFCALLMGLFIGRHLWCNWSLHRARRRLGLVVGGWGTRGKSSVERLKAALFNALGYSVVSKTTGCEAMLLYSPAFGTLQELFLFRPYDKATIWEQRDVVRTADRLDTDVFLWECMGLTPAYVDVLQRQWMRDDLSTLTNTYPDHEDIQGPAGINIPEVMTLFIPEGGRLLTSEEQMLPILLEAAREKSSEVSSVGWKEAALIPADVLGRFPYEEHPYNIALVAEMAGLVGIDRNRAYKEMADRVVPDLGVLKTYPEASLFGRRLEFSNGMSANERHGCLSNWQRLALDRFDLRKDAGRWTTTVVNNRADRIPRSKVFAKILVEDISADCHVLIGGNLEGLRGYIEEAWEEYARQLTFWPEQEDSAESPEEILERLAVCLRQPVDMGIVRGRLEAMLGERQRPELVSELLAAGGEASQLTSQLEAGDFPEALIGDLVEHHRADLAAHEVYLDLSERVGASAGPSEELLKECRQQLRSWFMAKLVVVDDYYASGDEIIEVIARATPPNFRNHTVGIQNIKGTGLDFVYRWQAWERCHDSCRKLRSDDPLLVRAGVRELLSTQEFGVLSMELAAASIGAARKAPADADVPLADLDALEQRLTAATERVQISAGGSGDESAPAFGSVVNAILGVLESVLDAGDAIRRRRKADLIYRDLVGQRISSSRAIELLKELTKRQKGGWLRARLFRSRREASA